MIFLYLGLGIEFVCIFFPSSVCEIENAGFVKLFFKIRGVGGNEDRNGDFYDIFYGDFCRRSFG